MLDKAALQGHRTIRINREKFVIRRVNPLVDLPGDKIPSLFTTHHPSRRPAPAPDQKPENFDLAIFQKNIEDMKMFVAAGLVFPELVPVGKGELRTREAGMTIDDIFRDPALGTKLYFEILIHSLNRFKGLKALFFSIKVRYSLSTILRKAMASARTQWSSNPVSAL